MKRVWLAMGVLIVLVLANAVLLSVLNTNQDNGVYPVDADSTGIPIMFAWGQSLMIFACMILSLVIPKRGRIWSVINVIPALLAAGMSLLVALS